MTDGPGFSSGGGLANLFQGIQNIAKAIANANQTLSKVFPQQQGFSATATSGAATLPANPVKFMIVVGTDGVSYKIPLYNS
jgi:hypothetical protein